MNVKVLKELLDKSLDMAIELDEDAHLNMNLLDVKKGLKDEKCRANTLAFNSGQLVELIDLIGDYIRESE